MYKIPCTSQNMDAKTLPTDVCVFGHFGWLLLAAVHSVDHWFDSGMKLGIHVSSIVTYLCKNSFCCMETVANNVLNHWCIVDFDQLWANRSTQFEHSFLIDKCSCKMVNTQLQFTIDPNEFVEFFGVFQDNCQIRVT